MTRRLSTFLMAALAATLLTQGAGVRAEEAWQFEATPYLWASGMKGDVQAGRLPKTAVDMSFSDIMDTLDFGLMGAFEARKGRWGILLDGIYMKVSDSATASRSGPGPIGATARADAEARIEQSMLAGAVAYRVTDGPTAVDVIGGLRYTRLDVDAQIDASLFALAGTVKRSGNKDWIDPYVGARIQYPFAPRWTFVGYGDVGGFGVGADFTWQASAGVSYEFSKSVSGVFGYRYFKVRYDQDGFLYDMSNDGIYLGAALRF